ncbi:MAG: hypothetical protein HY290_18210 [Planctomycetia bacterium]|nr:hypothetical protein [Planctomycetia bacterium]
MERLAESAAHSATHRARARVSRAACLLFAALVVTSCSGCQIVIGVLQIFEGFPKTHNDFYVRTHHRSLSEKGKSVIVLVASPPSAREEEPSLDLDVMAEVSRQLLVNKVNVVESQKIAKWIDDNGLIVSQTELEPIGRHFDADFIVLFTFDDFGYLENNSPGLYRGHAHGKTTVAEMVDDKVTPGTKRVKIIYNNPFTAKYPTIRPISADQEGPDVFKRKFMGRLSEQLTRTFVDYRPEEEIQ